MAFWRLIVLYSPCTMIFSFPGPDPVLIYSDRREIRRYDMKTGEGANVVPDLTIAIGLDYDWKEQMVYWSDVKEDKIERAYLNGSNRQVVISTGLVAPEGTRRLFRFKTFMVKSFL